MKKEKEKLIRKVFFSRVYELTAVEFFLEEMAAKGLMFVKNKGIFYYFKKCEPIKLKIAVDVFDKATIFDTKEEKITLEYIEYCKEAGWDFIYSNGKIQYFSTNLENPIAIQTDDSIKFKVINKLTLIQYIPSWIVPLWFAIMFILQMFDNNMFLYNITNSYMLNLILIMALMGLMGIVSISHYLIFFFKNVFRIRNQKSMQYNNIKSVKLFNVIYFIIIIFIESLMIIIGFLFNKVFLFIMISIFVITALIIFIDFKRMDNKKIGRQTNIFIFIVMLIGSFILIIAVLGVSISYILKSSSSGDSIQYETEDGMVTLYYCNDKVPITLEDLGLGTTNYDYIDSYAQENMSILASEKSFIYSENFMEGADEGAGISYEIFETKYDWIMEKYLDLYLNKNEYLITILNNEYTAIWGANATYETVCKPRDGDDEEDIANYVKHRFIVYDTMVIKLEGDYTYSEEEAKIICSILRLKKESR